MCCSAHDVIVSINKRYFGDYGWDLMWLCETVIQWFVIIENDFYDKDMNSQLLFTYLNQSRS